LTVKDGTKTAHLTLIGTYATSCFRLTNDGHGGTLVADPPVNPAAARFVEAAAGFHGEAGAYAMVHAGGAVLFAAPALLTGATSSR
jgi:hypothetical protein